MINAPADPAVRVTPVEETRIPLAEETLSIEKRTVEVGQVRIRLHTEAEEHIARANLLEQRVEVERVPIGRVVTEAPPVREEGDTTIFPVLEEVVVFETRLVLKEELRVRRVSTSKDVAQTVTLRRQVADVERNGVGT